MPTNVIMPALEQAHETGKVLRWLSGLVIAGYAAITIWRNRQPAHEEGKLGLHALAALSSSRNCSECWNVHVRNPRQLCRGGVPLKAIGRAGCEWVPLNKFTAAQIFFYFGTNPEFHLF